MALVEVTHHDNALHLQHALQFGFDLILNGIGYSSGMGYIRIDMNGCIRFDQA